MTDPATMAVATAGAAQGAESPGRQAGPAPHGGVAGTFHGQAEKVVRLRDAHGVPGVN